MLSLGSDNHSGVHPLVWQAMAQSNSGHAPSYGTDELTAKALDEFKKQFGESVETFFVFNGTAANVLCLRALVESFEAVICADTAHLHLDECAAPENAIGCKILTLPSENHNGKITADQIEALLIRKGDQHFAQPRLVSITQCTEYGTCYTLNELRQLRAFTREQNLLFHIDGARLVQSANYLNCSLRDLTSDLGVDAVSFGGTKNGLLYGEAVLLFKNTATEKAIQNLKFLRKQYMQLPSKMRFLSAQFLAFFENELWRVVAHETHQLAMYLESRLSTVSDVKITQPVQANSVFARIPKSWVRELREHVFFYVWDESPGLSTFEVRLMISFDVTRADIDYFMDRLDHVRAKTPAGAPQ